MQAFRLCTDCDRSKLLDGGVQINPNRWLCAACWVKFMQKKTRHKAG